MFGTVEIKARPLKLAFLIDPNDVAQVRQAIQLACSLWGGCFYPIIPLYKRMPGSWREKPFRTPSAKKVILGSIEAFDPDILVQISKEVPAFVSELGLQIIKPGDIWARLDEDWHLSPRYGIGIFELFKNIFDEYFKYTAKYPVKVVVPKIPRQYALLWAAVFGDLPPEVLSVARKHYFEPLEITEPAADVSAFSSLFQGSVLFPRRVVFHALKHYRLRFGRDACVYLFDATKMEDIVDFWNLRASGRTVLPLPKQFLGNQAVQDLVVAFLRGNRIPWRHNPKVCDVANFIRSRNSTMEEMQDYAKRLKIERSPEDPSDSGFFGLQHWYPRIWDEWARDKDGGVADIYGQEELSVDLRDIRDMQVHLHPVVPKFVDPNEHFGAYTCANELNFRFYGQQEYLAEVFPKFSGKHFLRSISGLTSFRGDWRVGQHGLVRLVKNTFIDSRNLPAAEPIFFSWLADLGWRAELSSAGLLAKQIYKKLDGFPALLGNEKLLGLLEDMNGGTVKSDGSPVSENIIGADRDKAVAEVKTRLKGSSPREDLHEFLVSKGIFKLGLRTQCPNCLRRSWFALDAIKDVLDCPRCLNSFPAAGNVDKGTWSYKTAGPFSVPNYANGAYAVLLTLGFFDDSKLTTFRSTPVLSFTAKGPRKDLEADFALFWQDSVYGEKKEGVLFGECKTYGEFTRRDFERMRHLAKTFPGAVLVFSTLRKSLKKREIAEMGKIAKAGRKYWKAERPKNPVLILTGTELLNWERPPHCWDEVLQKKFDHLAGFLELCDATQQIYLNLPSWHQDWHDRWEQRRKRRMAQQGAGALPPAGA